MLRNLLSPIVSVLSSRSPEPWSPNKTLREQRLDEGAEPERSVVRKLDGFQASLKKKTRRKGPGQITTQ